MTTPRLGKVSLPEVIRRALDARTAELRVGMPATIESFDKDTQLASVRPCLADTVTLEDGTEESEALPVISDCPCHFPGGGGFSITFPVQKGDPCWLVFSDRSLDKWLDNGGQVDPVAMQQHHLTDASVFLGVRPKPGAIPDFDPDNFTIGKDGESADWAALATKVKDEIKALRDWCATLHTNFAAHNHKGTIVISALTCATDTLVPPDTDSGPPAVNDVASATVKIKG